MQRPISTSMYANYLVEVGKLVYIIGQNDITSHFKKLLEIPENKYKKYNYTLDQGYFINVLMKSHLIHLKK